MNHENKAKSWVYGIYLYSWGWGQIGFHWHCGG